MVDSIDYPIRIQQHAIARAYQRYGILLKPEDIECMVKLIQRSSGIYFARRISSTHKVHKVPYNGETYDVIYDTERKTIRTFLTKK